MPRYRRKPVVVEAIKMSRPISIETEGNTVKARTGDYLVTEKDGQQYPCNPELFEQEFELVKDVYSLKARVYKSLRTLKRKSKSLIYNK